LRSIRKWLTVQTVVHQVEVLAPPAPEPSHRATAETPLLIDNVGWSAAVLGNIVATGMPRPVICNGAPSLEKRRKANVHVLQHVNQMKISRRPGWDVVRAAHNAETAPDYRYQSPIRLSTLSLRP